jgi:APA family basic amino acid/polyamine antiporter
MARDRLFFQAMGAIHPRLGTPARAIALQAVLASLLILLGTFDQILAYFIFVTVAFLGLAVLGIYVLRRREPFAPTPTPGYPVTPAVFLGLVVLLLVLLAARSPLQAFLGVAVVAAGVPVYLVVFRRGQEP